MTIKTRLTLTLIVLVCLLSSSAWAQGTATHVAENDVYIHIPGSGGETAGQVLPVETLDRVTFTIIPRVHTKIAQSTGSDIEYHYIRICGGEYCVAVDPFTFNK